MIVVSLVPQVVARSVNGQVHRPVAVLQNVIGDFTLYLAEAMVIPAYG